MYYCVKKDKSFMPVDAGEVYERSPVILDVLEREMQERELVRVFRQKTANCFVPVNGFLATDIEHIVEEYVSSYIDAHGLVVQPIACVLSGSRCRGLEHEDSDIDVVLSYRGDIKESELFNLLSDYRLKISGVPVDINPIRKEETGTLGAYLLDVENYLTDKAKEVRV